LHVEEEQTFCRLEDVEPEMYELVALDCERRNDEPLKTREEKRQIICYSRLYRFEQARLRYSGFVF